MIDAALSEVLLERRGAVALLTLNRPERLNAMTARMLNELLAALESLAGDRDVRAVVITGAGRAFCAGADLAGEPVWGTGSAEQRGAELRRLMRSSELLHEMGKPTIAAVNGACAGAGMALACAADIRIASNAAVFRTAFVGAALSGDFGITWTLTQLLGSAAARRLLLLDERVDAAEALRLGLISAVHQPELLLPTAIAMAQHLAEQAPLALAAMKHNCNDAERVTFAAALDGEARRVVACADSEDAREAAAAFLAKRAPRFQGR